MKKIPLIIAMASLMAVGSSYADVLSQSDSTALSGSESRALATGGNSDSVSKSIATGGNSDSNSAAYGGHQKQGQGQGQGQKQGQGQDQGQGQGQGQGINYAPYTNVEGTDLSQTVPSFVLPGLTAGSNPCALSVSAGGSGAGFGFGLGWVYQDNDCNTRENLRIVGGMLRAQNNPHGQLVMKNIMCQSSSMWSALELASLEGGGAKLHCINAQPGIGSYVKLRDKGEITAPSNKVRSSSSSSAAASTRGDTTKGGFGY